MTVVDTGPLIEALKGRLEAALAGQGVPEKDGDPAPDIPVFTDVTEEKHRLYVRLEGFSMLQGNSKVGHSDRHTFLCRVVHQQTGKKITKATTLLSRVEGLIADAFKKWAPLENASDVRFVSSFEADEPEPAVTARVSRYQLNINGD